MGRVGDESHDADERDDVLVERNGSWFVVTLIGRRAIRRRVVPARGVELEASQPNAAW